MPDLVKQATGFELRNDWATVVECDAIQTLHAVSTALSRNCTYSDLLLDCVNFGGDVDSVAAIAMGLASLAKGYEKETPPQLIGALENDMFGRVFLCELDHKLAESIKNRL